MLLHEWEYNAADEPQLLVSPIGEVTFDKEEPIENLITWVYENGSFVPIGKLTQNESFSIVSDYLGTPVQAFNEQGELVWERELDIYGRVRKEKGTSNFVPFRYQGQYYDSEIDLCYNRFRYYDCNTGTYISKDPISILGGLNVYAYVRDTNGFVDAFGLFEFVTKEGFLFGSFKIKAPFNIPVQRFGNIPEGQVRPWGLRVGTSEFINRVFVAIKPEWNPLTVYNIGIIPKGTEIRIGIIGPQGLKYLGGLLQFNVNNSDVKNIKTRNIDRNKVKCKT